MSSTDRIQSIFRKPRQWGLRGDPFLWNELREHFRTAGIPETRDEFARQIKTLIRELTGSDLRSDAPVSVDRYQAGGMSSGHISPEWWQTTGIPLLTRQFATGPFSPHEDDSLE